MQAGDPGFTTAAVRPGERAEHWRHALGRLSDVHALHLHDQDSFAASVATVQLSGGTMMTNMRAGCSTLKHAFKAPCSGESAVVAMAYFSGRGVAVQRGRSVEVRAGDIVLRHAGEDTELHVQAPVWSLAIGVPRSRLAELDIAPLGDFFAPFKIDHRLVLAAPLEGMLRGLASRFADIDPAQMAVLEESVLHILGAATQQSLRPGDLAPDRYPHRWNAFERAVERHLCDPELSIVAIAAELGCSVRWLQKVLAARGLRFERYVLAQRLDRAERLLSQSSPGSITDLCFGLGFNDVSHFSRTFRRRFGLSPLAYRSRP